MLYYNANFVNNSNETSSFDFNDVRMLPLLHNVSDKKLAIVRFTLPISGMPLFTFPSYPLILALYGTEATVTYVGSDPDQNIHSIQEFLNCVNHAINSVGNSSKFWIVYNPDDKLFYLLSDSTALPVTSTPVLTMNENLFNFFDGFPQMHGQFTTNTTRQIITFLDTTSPYYVTLQNASFAAQPGQGIGDYLSICEVPCLDNWTDMYRILFLTNMPVEGEVSSVQNGLYQDYKMITDFEIDLGDSDIRSQNVIQYNPPGLYRWINMNGAGPLKDIEIKIFVQKKDFSIVPFLIAPNQTGSIKILFSNKDF